MAKCARRAAIHAGGRPGEESVLVRADYYRHSIVALFSYFSTTDTTRRCHTSETCFGGHMIESSIDNASIKPSNTL